MLFEMPHTPGQKQCNVYIPYSTAALVRQPTAYLSVTLRLQWYNMLTTPHTDALKRERTKDSVRL